jgi:hypothetical protein
MQEGPWGLYEYPIDVLGNGCSARDHLTLRPPGASSCVESNTFKTRT